MKNKTLVVAELLRILSTQKFADFYQGPFEEYICGDFVRDSPECINNQNEVVQFIENMVDSLQERN
ncbi:hypothetical protein EB001_24335 [bacterium]|nr:hypothetical protein [bacterium]